MKCDSTLLQKSGTPVSTAARQERSTLEIEHIVPHLTPEDRIRVSNLTIACHDCNQSPRGIRPQPS